MYGEGKALRLTFSYLQNGLCVVLKIRPMSWLPVCSLCIRPDCLKFYCTKNLFISLSSIFFCPLLQHREAHSYPQRNLVIHSNFVSLLTLSVHSVNIFYLMVECFRFSSSTRSSTSISYTNNRKVNQYGYWFLIIDSLLTEEPYTYLGNIFKDLIL